MPPLLWVGHIFGRVIAFFSSLEDDIMGIYLRISFYLLFRDNIDNFLSGEFFVLCCFCDLCGIGFGSYIGWEEYLVIVSCFYRIIGIFDRTNKGIRSIFLHLVIPDEIDQVYHDDDEEDEDVVKTRVQDSEISEEAKLARWV